MRKDLTGIVDVLDETPLMLNLPVDLCERLDVNNNHSHIAAATSCLFSSKEVSVSVVIRVAQLFHYGGQSAERIAPDK